MRTKEEQEASKIQRARHQVLNSYLQDGHCTLMQPSMVTLAKEHVQKQMYALHEFEEDLVPLPPPPEGFGDAEKFKFELSSTMVLVRDGSLMTVPALPWIMDHLPKYKAAGPLRDRYEHYVHMPSDYVKELVFNALKGNLPPLAVDKGRLHKEGPFKGQKALRPVVIGTALRRIAERVPAAQLRSKWTSLFSRYRQFGVAIPSGVEIAYHQTDLAIQKLYAIANRDRDQEPVCIQIDACDAYTRTSRSALIEAFEEHMPSRLKYHRMAYGGDDKFIMLWQGQVIDTSARSETASVYGREHLWGCMASASATSSSCSHCSITARPRECLTMIRALGWHFRHG